MTLLDCERPPPSRPFICSQSVGGYTTARLLHAILPVGGNQRAWPSRILTPNRVQQLLGVRKGEEGGLLGGWMFGFEPAAPPLVVARLCSEGATPKLRTNHSVADAVSLLLKCFLRSRTRSGTMKHEHVGLSSAAGRPTHQGTDNTQASRGAGALRDMVSRDAKPW